MTLAEYNALYEAIIELSGDIENECPRYNDVINPDDWNDECAAKYALVNEMIRCINDVPASIVEYAVKQGLVLPAVDMVFTDKPHTTINGVMID